MSTAVAIPDTERSVYRCELRAIQDTDGGRSISGYAARYGVLSHPIKDKIGRSFRERIASGAFKRILDSGEDVRMLLEHNPSLILGRRGAGTLELSSDNQGLKFRCLMPNTSYANDAYESIKRGDLNSMSFGFLPGDGEEEWDEDEDPETGERYARRTLRGFKKLTDISAVTYPAYPGTEVQARSLVTVPSFNARDRVLQRAVQRIVNPTVEDCRREIRYWTKEICEYAQEEPIRERRRRLLNLILS